MTFTCESIRELLYEHHAGELVVEVCEQFELHVVSCADCTHFVESYRQTVRVVRKLPKCELPQSVEARLRAALKEFLEG